MKKSKLRRRTMMGLKEEPSVEALLLKPNPWSDWMGADVPLFGSMRFAALLLRDVPVPTVVNLLAPALEKARDSLDTEVLALLDQGHLGPGKIFTFANWLSIQGDMRKDCFAEATREVIRQLRGSRDTELFTSAVDHADFDPLMLLYLFMNAIRHWCGIPKAIEPANRWLIELEPHGEQDGLGMLYAHFYNRFRAEGHFPCERLPLELEVITADERSIYFDEVPDGGSEFAIEKAKRFAFDDARQVLPEVLGEDSRAWRKRATLLSRVERRRRGGEPPAATEVG